MNPNQVQRARFNGSETEEPGVYFFILLIYALIMKTLPRLEEQTAEDFAALGQGTFSFLCRFPDGRDYTVKIKTRSRPKTWQGQLDVFSTDWVIKSPGHPSGYRWCLTVDCSHEQFGIEMQKAVRSLSAQLMPLKLESTLAGQSED